MADNILSDFGINLLEEEVDDVIFQTNEFLCDATFTGSQGPFWWLLVVSENLPLLGCSIAYYPITYKILFRETNPRRDKNGTEPQENKIKNALLRISESEYLLLRCKGTNLSRQKRIKTHKVHIYSAFFYFPVPRWITQTDFCPDWTGWHQKAVLKSVSWLLTAMSGENVSGCTDILPEVLSESGSCAPLNTES